MNRMFRSFFGNKRNIMITAAIIVVVVIMICVLLLEGPKKSTKNKSVKTEQAEAGLVINADKSFVVVYDEEFDKNYYDEKELEQMVDAEVLDFNTNFAQDSTAGITKESFKVSGGRAILKLRFTNYNDYVKYATEYVNPGEETKFFIGSYSEAMTMGYLFDKDFNNEDDAEYDVTEIEKDTNNVVFITNEGLSVEFNGKTIAKSTNVTKGKDFLETVAGEENYIVINFN